MMTNNGYRQETSQGSTEVEIESPDRAEMIYYEQYVPPDSSPIMKQDVSAALGLETKQLNKDFCPTAVHTDVIVGIRSAKELEEIEPNHDRIKLFLDRHGMQGIHAFSLDEEKSHFAAHCRNFASAVGIPEESATGSATGLMVSQLLKQRVITTTRMQSLLFSQGNELEQPSEISVRIKGTKHEPLIYVGGRATFDSQQGIVF